MPDEPLLDVEISARLPSDSPDLEPAGDFTRAAILLERLARMLDERDFGTVLKRLPATSFDAGQLALLVPLAKSARAVAAARAVAVRAAHNASGTIPQWLDLESKAHRKVMFEVVCDRLASDEEWSRTISDIAAGSDFVDRAEDLERLARIYWVEAPRLKTHQRYRAGDRLRAVELMNEIYAALKAAGVPLAYREDARRLWNLVAATYDDVRETLRWIERRSLEPLDLPAL